MDSVQLLEGLLRIYSPSYQEREAVDYLVAQMNALGLHAFRDEAGNAVGMTSPPMMRSDDALSNAIRVGSHHPLSYEERGNDAPHRSLSPGERGGDVSARSLANRVAARADASGVREIVLLGHIDTAPGIVEIRREGEFLFGRGAVDAKGPLCAFASAAARVGARPGWRIVVVGAVEEECPTSKGAHYAKTQYSPAFAIVGEPSGWDRVTLGYKGSLWLEYQLTRENAHSAGQARSANEDAVDFWLKVKAYADAFNQGKTRAFDRLDPTLRGMHSENDGLHEHARLVIGLRLPLDVTVAGLEESLIQMAGDGQLKFDTETPAYRVEKNNALVRAFLSGIREQGGTPGFTLKTGTSDMNVVGPHWNCPIVTYGPGDSNLDHTPNEHINIQEYEQAIGVLSRVLEQLTTE